MEKDLLQVKNDLLVICGKIKEQLIAELTRQGHKASGALLDSIDVALEQTVYSITIFGRFAYYGPYVDYGRNASIKRVPIDALIEWIRIKKMDLKGKSEQQVAFAIQMSIFKKGIPTDRNIGKKRFMSGTLEKMEEYILTGITDAFGKYVEAEIFNIVETTRTSVNSMK